MHFSRPLVILAVLESSTLALSVSSGIYLRVSAEADVDAVARLISFIPEMILFTAVVMTAMFSLGLYNWQFSSKFSDIFTRLFVSFLISTFALSVIFYTLPDLTIWRSALAIAMLAAFPALIILRLVFLQIVDNSQLKHKIIIIGVGERAAQLEDREHDGRSCRFVCAGFVQIPGEQLKVTPERILPDDIKLVEYVEENGIDEIVVAVQDRRGHLPLPSLVDCRLNGTAITDYMSFRERESLCIDLNALNPSWFLFSEGFPGGRLQQAFKRALDIAVSLVMLIFLLPIIVATAIAVRLESPGPIFYRQERMGFRGKTFVLTKFRSMRVDAERDGPQWAAANDSRVTAVGAFVRKTRIDEIPQILNVLRGDMSLVGPRPERPFFVEQLADVIPYYSERHRVKPGVTGWAQLNYPYGASIEDARQKLQYDLYYIKYYSLLLDLSIIAQTVRVVLWPQGVR
ncbi:TIGR03013 family XrtA/PEP-CTERM system glycosyltransferase [Pelagibius sp. Alg239-R121]|uniref:TIGR03013 family XrtA/PEP-CTERM system glycosyltransferase n=1 Tax=Pelagibius sp. Alg239-R121 TaxID=2993448 RepID=UPI0024A667D7|nr:TIGR03013 family XrtA/PEP-CTERM system glycosyltransferase [Pelagibius sp. Alg239-R121]